MKMMVFFLLLLLVFNYVQHSLIFFYFFYDFLSALSPLHEGKEREMRSMYQERHCCIVFPVSSSSLFWDPDGFLSPPCTPK